MDTGSDRELMRRLRARGTEPSEEFVRSISARLRSTRRRSLPLRAGLALAFVVLLLIPLAAFGGMGYAASTVKSAISAVHIGKSHAPAPAAPAAHVTPADAQYNNGKHCGQPGGGPKKPNQRPCPPQAGPKH